MTIRVRASKRMKQIGHSMDSLAAYLGITTAELLSFFNEPTKHPRGLTLRISQLLKTTESWLIGGIGEPGLVGYGQKIRDARKSKGLSQQDLAPKLGVSRVALSNWETEGTYPPNDKRTLLCEVIGLSEAYMFGIDTDPGSFDACYNLFGCNLGVDTLISARSYPYPGGDCYSVLIPRYSRRGVDLSKFDTFTYTAKTKLMEPVISKGALVVGVSIDTSELLSCSADSIYILTINDTPYLCRLSPLPDSSLALSFDGNNQAGMRVSVDSVSLAGRILSVTSTFE